jgi:hypothetical protein
VTVGVVTVGVDDSVTTVFDAVLGTVLGTVFDGGVGTLLPDED